MVIRALKNAIKFSLDLVARMSDRQIFIVPRYMRRYDVFDLNMLSAYWNQDEDFVAYENSMRRAGFAWSDNISKRARFYSLYQMANLTFDRLDGKGDVAECGVWQGHSAHMVASFLKQLWQPQFTLKQGLAETIEWVKQNIESYRADTYSY